MLRYDLYLVAAMVAILPVAAHATGDSVSVIVSGSVGRSCSLSAPSSADLSSINQAGSKQIDFNFSCNAPFSVSVRSKSGALNHDAQRVIGPFATSVPYQMNARLPFDSGGVMTVTSCSSGLGNDEEEDDDHESGDDDSPSSCQGSNSSGKTSIGQTGSLLIKWDTPVKPLVAGPYRDVVTIKISAEF